jgi:hypothetical protein
MYQLLVGTTTIKQSSMASAAHFPSLLHLFVNRRRSGAAASRQFIILKMEEELVQEEVECMNKAHALLKAVMEHPSNNFGDAPFQADADADDDDGIAYDTDSGSLF